MSGTRGKEYTMIIGKKNENDSTAERTECGCPMLDFIAKLIALDLQESDELEIGSAHTLLLYDLIIKLYEREEYKEAMEALAVAFMLSDMENTSQLISVATSGYTESNAKFFMDRLFEYSNLRMSYEVGRQIFEDEEAS